MLKAPAEQLISPFFHLFKFLLAYSDLLFAVLKSYGKKKSQELLLKKSLSKYLEQMYTGCHEQYQRKHLLQKKEHTNIVWVSFQISNGRPTNQQSYDVFNLLCATSVWSKEQYSSPNSFWEAGSPKQHQHWPGTAPEPLKFLILLISSQLSGDTDHFAEMLMYKFWTTYTVPPVM